MLIANITSHPTEELKEHRLDEVELKKRKKQEKAARKAHEAASSVEDSEDSDIEGMDYSEVRASSQRMQVLRDVMNTVPPYLFLSPAEKRKYFGSISKRFSEAMAKEAGSQCSHERSVRFDLGQNQVRGRVFSRQRQCSASRSPRPPSRRRSRARTDGGGGCVVLMHP